MFSWANSSSTCRWWRAERGLGGGGGVRGESEPPRQSQSIAGESRVGPLGADPRDQPGYPRSTPTPCGLHRPPGWAPAPTCSSASSQEMSPCSPPLSPAPGCPAGTLPPPPLTLPGLPRPWCLVALITPSSSWLFFVPEHTARPPAHPTPPPLLLPGAEVSGFPTEQLGTRVARGGVLSGLGLVTRLAFRGDRSRGDATEVGVGPPHLCGFMSHRVTAGKSLGSECTDTVATTG